MAKLSAGTWGWLGIAGFVLAYDTWAMAKDSQTLSTAFKINLGHPKWRWVVLPAWLLTSLHLFGLLPARIDPFKGYGNILGRFRKAA